MAIETLEQFCEATGGDARDAVNVIKALESRQVFNCARQNARLARCAGNGMPERKPLMEDGHEWGRVEASIPRTMFFQLMQQKNFGYEGLTSEDGIKDILRDYPQCRVKTVSGKAVIGVSGFGNRRSVKSYG